MLKAAPASRRAVTERGAQTPAGPGSQTGADAEQSHKCSNNRAEPAATLRCREGGSSL